MQVKIAESLPKSVSCKERSILKQWKSLCRCIFVKEEIILISASAVNVSQVNKYQLGKFPHLTSLIFYVRRRTYRFYGWSLKIPEIDTYRAQTASKQDNWTLVVCLNRPLITSTRNRHENVLPRITTTTRRVILMHKTKSLKNYKMIFWKSFIGLTILLA